MFYHIRKRGSDLRGPRHEAKGMTLARVKWENAFDSLGRPLAIEAPRFALPPEDGSRS